ncbi:OmpA domain protein [Plesiocystis pacifica SIR-1]|uniref:OmpA domain protein n=2 Tax=Plesiocystis pacifica TaxID=191768 RepID=A6FWX9_9BACT|nr:OmpA domain protein [Plesiocystis pacifica SIR-1]
MKPRSFAPHLPDSERPPMIPSPARPLALSLLVPAGLVCSALAPALALAGEPAPAGDPAAEPAPAPAPAEDASAGGSAELSLDGGRGDAKASATKTNAALESTDKKRLDVPWLERWAPERNMAEIGVYGGLFFPSDDHDFYHPDTAPQKPLWQLNGAVGLRASFQPLTFLGVEAEGGVLPSKIRSSTNDTVILWKVRGHLIAQLPYWSVSPFVLIGGGAMGVNSPNILLGDDIDPAMHWGGGLKVYVNRWIALRVEGRHILSAKSANQRDFTSHAELLAGLSFTLGRQKPKPIVPEDPDRDKDGFENAVDSCPDTPGVSPDGCPPRDTDEDGWIDTEDECPYEAGVEPDGCPIRDTDGDGILDDTDACIDEPEKVNGYKDEDGCPDEVPIAVREFTGVIEGIEFEYNSATIREGKSKEVLDAAIKVLEEYPEIRIKVVGHTDNQGTPEYNKKLSTDRADAVKQYLAEGGIAEDRIETFGAGQSDPLTTNETEEGRAKNRRTEFEIIKKAKPERAKPTTEGE